MILDYVIYRFPFSRKVTADVWDVVTQETYASLAGTDYPALEQRCEMLCEDEEESTP